MKDARIDNSAMMNVAICLPARNERENVELLLAEINKSLSHRAVEHTTVVVFDDGSDDSTFAHLRTLSFENFDLQVLRSMVPVGKAVALRHAFDESLRHDADAIIMMDADFQDDPRFISDILDELLAGADVVNGRRVNRQHSGIKRLSSKAFNGVVRWSSGLKFLDINSGYKGFSRVAVQSLSPYLYGELHRVLLVIAVWLGLTVGEVRVTNRARRFGTSKYGFARAWRGLFDMWTIQFLMRYHASPGHFFSGIGSTLVVSGVVTLLVSWLSPLALQPFVTNGTALAVSIGALLFGAVFISFGFLAELVLFLSKNAPTSVIRSAEYRGNIHSSKSDKPKAGPFPGMGDSGVSSA